MEELKSLFGEGSLSYDEFQQKLDEAGETIKLANLKSGNYVDKAKFEKLEKSSNELQTKYSALEEKTKDYDSLVSERDNYKTSFEELQSKQATAEKMELVKSSNVNPKFEKFVYTEVSSQVTDEKDFKSVLEEYLNENKQFLNGSQHSFVDLENGEGGSKSSKDKINDFIRKRGN